MLQFSIGVQCKVNTMEVNTKMDFSNMEDGGKCKWTSFIYLQTKCLGAKAQLPSWAIQSQGEHLEFSRIGSICDILTKLRLVSHRSV